MNRFVHVDIADDDPECNVMLLLEPVASSGSTGSTADPNMGSQSHRVRARDAGRRRAGVSLMSGPAGMKPPCVRLQSRAGPVHTAPTSATVRAEQ
jgi:hypothetical protein